MAWKLYIDELKTRLVIIDNFIFADYKYHINCQPKMQLKMLFASIFLLDTIYLTCMQTVWTQIRLLHMEQSDLGPYRLL